MKGKEPGGTRTDTNYCAIFGLFIFSGDGGWAEKNKSEEEEESERQARDEAGCMRPCWTRHVEGRKRVGNKQCSSHFIFILDTNTGPRLATYATSHPSSPFPTLNRTVIHDQNIDQNIDSTDCR